MQELHEFLQGPNGTTKNGEPCLPVIVPEARTTRPLRARRTLTRAQRKAALKHVLATILELDPDEDAKVYEALKNAKIRSIHSFVALERQDVLDLELNGKNGLIGMVIGNYRHILSFLGFVQWRKDKGKPIEDSQWLSLTGKEFDAYVDRHGCRLGETITTAKPRLRSAIPA